MNKIKRLIGIGVVGLITSLAFAQSFTNEVNYKIQRQYKGPLEAYSVFNTVEDLNSYAVSEGTRAYPGQVVSLVIEGTNKSYMIGFDYSLVDLNPEIPDLTDVEADILSLDGRVGDIEQYYLPKIAGEGQPLSGPLWVRNVHSETTATYGPETIEIRQNYDSETDPTYLQTWTYPNTFLNLTYIFADRDWVNNQGFLKDEDVDNFANKTTDNTFATGTTNTFDGVRVVDLMIREIVEVPGDTTVSTNIAFVVSDGGAEDSLPAGAEGSYWQIVPAVSGASGRVNVDDSIQFRNANGWTVAWSMFDDYADADPPAVIHFFDDMGDQQFEIYKLSMPGAIENATYNSGGAVSPDVTLSEVDLSHVYVNVSTNNADAETVGVISERLYVTGQDSGGIVFSGTQGTFYRVGTQLVGNMVAQTGAYSYRTSTGWWLADSYSGYLYGANIGDDFGLDGEYGGTYDDDEVWQAAHPARMTVTSGDMSLSTNVAESTFTTNWIPLADYIQAIIDAQ